MKVTVSTVSDILSRLRIYFQARSVTQNYDNEEPIRSELYSSDQMNRHGLVVARAHRLMTRNSPDQLLKRLGDNEKTLLEVRNLLVESIGPGKIITPAAEWLLDNFYLIEEQVVIARKHLPKGYSEGLPCLAEGVSAGLPRVYDIVLEVISHSDGRVDVKGLGSFIEAYQGYTLLTLGELWAIPIMLRLAVLENLRRIAGRIALDMIDHNLADYWADRLAATVKEEPANLILTIADMARAKPVLGSPFVAAFTRKLQGKGPALALPLTWMEQQLSAAGSGSNDLVRQENQKQAADQVSVRNSIGTLRVIGATDWRDFVESLSSVEQVLRQDITGTYPRMDFATRDRYRHAVESISKQSALSETEVARQALALAGKHGESAPAPERYRHIGYYLIDTGRRQTERAVEGSYTLKQRLTRTAGRMPVALYLSSIALLTMLATASLVWLAHRYGALHRPWLLATGVLVVSCSSQLAVSLVNWLATILVKPRLLPRMDFSGGIPVECRTLVVVPTMLTGKTYIEELVEGLEIRFLANRGAHLHFGLLTDLPDADAEVLAGDKELLELAAGRIEALNQRYPQEGEDIFFLFHRPRTWNARERKWMGHERKRGKLSALNALIRGRGGDEFSLVIGRRAILTKVKYVITLDSDTQLPGETAWKLVAAMEHPLNRPIYNPEKKRVTEGYGILQPRVAPAIPKTPATPYLRMLGNVSGIDPYTRVSSDVYQDLFAEGSFTGKGIYDVDIFEQAVLPAFQENRILSHDLLEGCYTRSGLLSDVLLYEEGPAQYRADINRHHRWIRGDWQIGAWILPFVTDGSGRLVRNKLSGLSRWKIFDNLRRSVFPLSILSLLLMGWSLLPFPWFWTLAVTAILLLAVVAATGWQFFHKPTDLTFRAHVSETGASLIDALMRFVFGLAVLPYEAARYTDAILRTNWRMAVTRRNLLEWAPSATAAADAPDSVRQAYRSMWIAPMLAIAGTGLIVYTNPAALYIAAPVLLLWLLAPAITWRLGVPEREKATRLSDVQVLFLHRTARKTWAFFEHFVTGEEHWLPPDNYQEEPALAIAHRTSPTNIGLSLLAALSAYDFGYIGGGELLTRCSRTLQSMLQMDRYRGHFYNWYDTRTLLPLHPKYVSTVDSGNLAGHLLTLRQGLLALPGEPIFSKRVYEGLRTTAGIVPDISGSVPPPEPLQKILALLTGEAIESYSLHTIKIRLDTLIALTDELKTTDASEWPERLSLQIRGIRDDLARQVPWLDLLPVPERFGHLAAADLVPSLATLSELPGLLQAPAGPREDSPEETEWLGRMSAALVFGSNLAAERITLSEQLAAQCEQLSTMAYDFLFDKATSLLRIGYNVDEQRTDDSYYDLLASEARLGVFVGIAQGKLPQESWFALGRLLVNAGDSPILLSWSGSMFEYLMPELVMPSYKDTLLFQTNKATVRRQIEYGEQRGTPWGISESAYNMVDANLNYQYRAFGVPGLGLKRGLKEDLVIAPYASLLALMVSPGRACANLQSMSRKGFEGEFGFFEAIDYTPARVPRGKVNSVIHSFMAHHQGMGLLSLAYLLLNKPMQQRFTSEPRFQANLLLLQERIPRATLFYAHTADLTGTYTGDANAPVQRISTAGTAIPEIQLLGNGSYQVMITNAGGGYSRWKGMAVTRWREDITKEDHGIFCYIKDTVSGQFWSNTHQPTLQVAKGYEAIFSQGHVEFRRRDYGIDTKTEIVVSPEDDVEMRKVSITNKSQTVRILEITSYAEVVLASQGADEAHPAFSNLFVQTEIQPECKAVFCTRRARSRDEIPPWMFHLMEVQGALVETVSYETDRTKFIGRGKTLEHPQAMDDDVLGGNQGSVLDPIVSIRYRIHIKPSQTATLDLIYGVSDTKEACQALMQKYRDPHLKNRAFELSWTHSQVLLRQINATESDAQLYERLAASVIYPNAALRADASVMLNNFRGQSGLWSHSVSGDLPIVLLHIHDPENVALVEQMVQAHAYWRLKGLAVDLVIWNEDYGSYRQLLQERILGLITTEAGSSQSNTTPGHIYVKSADQISNEDRILFESVARVIIHDNNGSLSDQVNTRYAEKVLPPALEVKPVTTPETEPAMTLPENLVFANGRGGFTPDGREYKILTNKSGTTPAPWVNVLANPDFGTVISESGSAYTWAVNAHEYRITPWNNDPVSDTGGEAFYLRDEETGRFWSPSPFPARGATPYVTTHGFGYSLFQHKEQGVSSEMCVFVDQALPVKCIVWSIKNLSGRERKFTATGFLEIILGDLRSKTSMHILSEQDEDSGALLFRNRYNTTFADRVTFFKVNSPNPSFTADRTAFVGRNRNLESPQALSREKLSSRTGAGMDPCAGLQVRFDLLPGAEKEMIFLIGSGEDARATTALIRQFSDSAVVAQSLAASKAYWRAVLDAVQVTTPDAALNILANGWLTYQTMACRLFARSGFYQSGGAFGFRDQLQDVLALLHTRPELARAQILLSASRQFVQGDVQHWWHPPDGKGVRTHCSDDLLWLPFVATRYVAATGDTAILAVKTPYLESRPLQADEDSLYDLPATSNQSAPLYEHCVRAIQHALRFGKHGLPLIGSGDWNDGMDQVGNKGAGESVWLAFFLYDILLRFKEVATGYGDDAFAGVCTQAAASLQAAIEAAGWDGRWYRRAYFDDGSPLGSAENEECRIDSIAQSWAVISGAADSTRAAMAMDSLDEFLVKRDLGLIQLLDPPFSGHGLNPGYIKGYVPGVRENGGQYTHAAIWALMAFAALGRRSQVWELFSMILPPNHTANASAILTYKTEPYVMAADVYASAPHTGRGGWTWYTGSAGWTYQFITGSLLGMELLGNRLRFRPCFPLDWPSVSIRYRYRTSTYSITVFQVADDSSASNEGVELVDDGGVHEVEVRVGSGLVYHS